MTTPARLTALLIAAVAVAALIAQGIVASRLPAAAGIVAVIWVMAAYFTVLINLVFAISFLRVAVTGQTASAGWNGALLLWIGTVGLIYHVILAGIWSPQGLGWWADQGLHTATPLLGLLWWLAVAPKAPLNRTHPLRWALLPLAYCAYVLVRGQFTATYPYPFIDLNALGPARTALNVALLTAGFVLAGYALLFAARRLDRQQA